MEKIKKITHPTSITNHLPSELESNILLRLPIKDLIRCRCVCKRWRDDIINNPNFISLHTNHLLESNKTNPSGSIILYCRQSSRLYSLDYHSPEDVKKVTRLSNFPITHQRIVGSCNGLLCFHEINNVGFFLEPKKCRQFSLYNPVTGAVNILPPLFPKNEGCQSKAGFGYDSISHDYKILCLVYNFPFPEQSESYVYSLKSNSWKFTKPDFVSKTTDSSYMVYSNNALHWIAYNSYSNLPTITSFDLGSEEYCEVPHPDLVGHDTRRLADLRGCLHLVKYWKPELMYIWVMKEYGVKQTWYKLIGIQLGQYVRYEVESQAYWGVPFNKHYKVDSYFPSLPLAYSQDGQQVLVGLGENVAALLQCDLHSGKFKELEICGLPDDWTDGYVAMPWIGSLVPPSSLCN